MSDERKPRIDWERVRAEYEIGGPDNTARALGVRHGVSHTAVNKRKLKEGWAEPGNLEEAISKKVSEKVSGVVSSGNPVKRAAAIEAEAERRAAVIREHQAEWEEIEALRQRVFQALNGDVAVGEVDSNGEQAVLMPVAGAFELAKLAKIMAEQTNIKQMGQRKAYGLEAKEDGKRDGVANLADAMRQARERASGG